MYTLLLPWFTKVICKVDISVTLICPSTFVCVSSLSLREDLNVIRGPCCPKSLFLFSKGYIYMYMSKLYSNSYGTFILLGRRIQVILA